MTLCRFNVFALLSLCPVLTCRFQLFDVDLQQMRTFHLRLGILGGDKSQQQESSAMRGSNADSFCFSCDIRKAEAIEQAESVNVREFRRRAEQISGVYQRIEEEKSQEQKQQLRLQHGVKEEQVPFGLLNAAVSSCCLSVTILDTV